MLKSYHDGYHDEIGSLTCDDVSDTFTASCESDLEFTTREILIFIDISKVNHLSCYFLSKMPIHVYSIFFFISTLQKSRVKVRDNLFFSVFYDKSILNTFFCLMPNFFTSRKTNLAVKYLFCFYTNISNHCLLFSRSGSLYKLHNHR